jgi:transglutaminase-like putative cysteine protease
MNLKLLSYSKLFLAFVSLFFLSVNAFATKDEDKNIVIENKTQTFRFQKGKGDNPVTIKEEYAVKYRCKEVRDAITFGDMYNDQETIDDVDIYVNDKKAKYIIPKYDYYSVKDIFYSDARVCYFNLPLDKKDASAEVKLSKTHKDPRYLTTEYFTDEYFTEKKTVTFVIPRWMKVDIKEFNFAGNSITKATNYDAKEDADVTTYTITNLKPFVSESYAPGASFIYPHLLILSKEATTDAGIITYFNTVADQYKWCYGLVQQVGDDNTALATKAQEITKGITGDMNKVKAIYNWVQHNIRYIAYEDGIAGFKPAKAMDVLNKKYGDCKGMANLITGLVRGIGLDARHCWIGTNHIAYDLSTPALSVHNHMIAAWVYNGKTYYLDGTETNIAFNEYAERIAGRQVLVENGDKYILTNVPTVVPEQNPDKEKRILTIEGTDLKGSSEHTYRGEARSDILSKIQSVKKDNLTQALTNYLSEDNQDYKITNLKNSELLGVDSILKISYDIHYKNGLTAFGNDMYAEMDFRKDMDNFIIDTAKRKQDFMLPFKMNINHETELTIPTGYKITTLPANVKLQHPNMDVTITYKQQGNKLVYSKQLKINKIKLQKADFNTWNTLIQQLTEKYKEQLVMSK